MPCLIEAFKDMRRQGLIAKRQCYCEHCGQDVIRKAIRRSRAKQRDVRGFVHVGECQAQSLEEMRVPLVFGSVTGEEVASNDPGCLVVGEVIARCLEKQDIQFEWDRVPGHPILVVADHFLTGIPGGGHLHAIDVSDDHRAYHTYLYPGSVFDRIEGNPVRLLNLAKLRRLNIPAPHLNGPLWQPCVDDQVKLGFYVPDAIAPLARRELGDMVRGIQLEAMWVEVTSVVSTRPKRILRGELTCVPVFIDPARLRIGSPVDFIADMVYPAEKRSRQRARR
jgi:hypothetical protein